jgi:hypothetical protein
MEEQAMTRMTSLLHETIPTDLGALTPADPAQAADSALTGALAYAAQMMGRRGPQSVLDCLVAGDDVALGYFQYALARHLAGYLAGFDDEVKAIYVFDDEATEEDRVFGEVQPICLLHLIVWARRKTEALYSLAAAVDRALATCYAERAGMPKAAHLLDVQVIDDGDIQRGKGYAALLNSIPFRPMLVWAKQ